MFTNKAASQKIAQKNNYKHRKYVEDDRVVDSETISSD